MRDDSSSRPGSPHDPLCSSQTQHLVERSSRQPHWRRVGFALTLGLLLFLQVFGNATVVSAAATPPVRIPADQGNFTVQKFLQQAHPAQHKDAPLPVSGVTPPRGVATPNKTTQPKPSTEPPTMKAASQQISASFLQAPAVPASLDPGITGSAGSTPSLHVVGNDSTGVRLEVLIPPGAIDVSQATTTKGTAPELPLTIHVSQLSGHVVGMNTSLGTFQIQITDAQGATVSGITLRSPANFILHYRKKELQQLDLEPSRMLMSWPTLTTSSNATMAKNAVIRMNNNAVDSTLSAQSMVLASAAVTIGISDPMNQSPQKPHVATTGGNTGQVNYSYPFVVAPGPQGTAPTLAANYSSAATNGRHSPTAPTDNMGEGWSLSTPSITTLVEGGGSVWYSINGLDGVSDRLIPDHSTVGNGTSFATEHLSYLKIQMVDAGFDSQSCFHAWDTASNYYEFGCTHDSMQYYTDSNNNRTNYRFDINKFMPAHDGDTSRVVTYKYVQVSNTDSGYYTIRDAALVQIVYGTSTTPAGTVDLFYKGPSNQSVGGTQFVTAYGNNEGGCTPPDGKTTTKRCDDPEDKDGGLPNAWVLSVLSLSTIKTYVGDDSSTSHLDYSYAFNYTDTPYTNCKDAQSGTNEYCAGNHLLTSITPTVYQNGTGHALPGVTFGYSAGGDRLNKYEDSSQSVPAGGHYKVQTDWRYLTSYHDHSNGVGATIVWHTAYNNSHGTPYSSGDSDNRYDTFYCVWHSGDCSSGSSFYPYYDKMWTEQVVYQITQIGTDSSASSLSPGTTTYHYWLTKTTGSCPADAQSNSDCVGFGWIPDSTDGWQDYYHGEFRGFGTVLVTSPAGDLTVQKYYATEGWDSSEADAGNYLAGSLYEEDIYAGGNIDNAKLFKQTLTTYAGTNSTHTSCSSAYIAGLYKPCEIIPLSSKTTLYEQTGSAGPWVQTTNTWDDYNSSSGLIAGKYHNQLSEATSGSNIATRTQNWTYQTTDTTVGSNVYYNVHTPVHSELVDASGHTWSCSDTAYDEGRSSGLPSPSAGWPTTVKTYSKCGDSNTAITTYAGYDLTGNPVAAVDGVGAANASLYSSNGCTLATAPVYLTSSWTAGHYTGCTAYSSANALPTDTWNAFGHHNSAVYDSTQGLLMTSATDANNQTTTQSESFDSSGNVTTSVKQPGETASYSQQGTITSTCTDSSTLPCLEVDGVTSLYSSTVTRTFYDTLGRAVETLMPGPDSTHTTVTFTVYNDAARSVFTSLPFRVATRTTWLDPNTATDDTGQPPKGTETDSDALGRVIKTIDALSNTTTATYGVGTSGVSGDSQTYAITTAVDANNHVGVSYTNVLGQPVYTVTESGTNGGTLTPNQRTTSQYNALGKPISVTVTDLTPQSGQSVTSVTATTQYDDLGRVISVNDPDKGTHTLSYDADSHTISDVSGSRTIGTSYDLLGRMGCVQDAAPSLDAHGGCTSGAHPFVQNTYDADPSGVSWSGSNYAVGRLTQSVTTTALPDPDNTVGTVTENQQYDLRGRVNTKRMQIATSGGTLAFPTFPLYQIALSYNDADQLTTTQTTVGGQAGFTFTQSYDSTLGLLNGLSNTTTAAPSLVGLSYNELHGMLSDLTFKNSSGANLATEHLSYDGLLRPSSKTTTWQSDGSTIFSDSVGYDKVGNVLSRATTQAAVPGVTGSGGSETQNFCYDEQSRLVWASNSVAASPGSGQTCGTSALQSTLGSSYTTNYTYTHLGQLWRGPLNGSGTTEQYLYCNNSHPHQVTALAPTSGSPTCSASGTPDYSGTYDTWGNLITRNTGGKNGSLSYDAFDEMIRWNGTTSSNSQEEWYLYDAAGNRVLRRSATTAPSGNPATAAATITVYAFGVEEHTYSYSGSGTTLTNSGNTYYYSLGGRLIGTLSGTSSQTTNFLLTDTLGSVVTSISNTASSSAVLGTQIYGPYGNKRTSAGTIGTVKGYTGQYNDDVTGLDYYNARYYDPVIGRFLSADSVQDNLIGMDPYAYVGGNPETETDPTGMLNYVPGSGMAWTPGSTTTYYWGQPFGSQQSSTPQWSGGIPHAFGGQPKPGPLGPGSSQPQEGNSSTSHSSSGNSAMNTAASRVARELANQAASMKAAAAISRSVLNLAIYRNVPAALADAGGALSTGLPALDSIDAWSAFTGIKPTDKGWIQARYTNPLLGGLREFLAHAMNLAAGAYAVGDIIANETSGHPDRTSEVTDAATIGSIISYYVAQQLLKKGNEQGAAFVSNLSLFLGIVAFCASFRDFVHLPYDNLRGNRNGEKRRNAWGGGGGGGGGIPPVLPFMAMPPVFVPQPYPGENGGW